MRADLTDLDSMIINVRDPGSRDLISEALQAYRAGALRSAIVFWVFRNPGGKSGSPGDTGGVEIKAAEMKVDGVAESFAVAEPAR